MCVSVGQWVKDMDVLSAPSYQRPTDWVIVYSGATTEPVDRIKSWLFNRGRAVLCTKAVTPLFGMQKRACSNIGVGLVANCWYLNTISGTVESITEAMESGLRVYDRHGVKRDSSILLDLLSRSKHLLYIACFFRSVIYFPPVEYTNGTT